MKIYTKTGDEGKTSLIGGKTVNKSHPLIETCGTIDELNSFIGLLRDQKIDNVQKNILLDIQKKLFVIETQLHYDTEVNTGQKHVRILVEDVQFLENQIDIITESLPKLKHFILPGGHVTVSYCHVCRTVCRRAERLVVKLAEQYNISTELKIFLNRLSDYFFVLARKFLRDFEVKEEEWVS